MALQDLEILGQNLKKRFLETFNDADRVLPEAFKSNITQFDSSPIEYRQYNFIVKSSSGLNIYFPNQAIYIAAYFADYYVELEKYKNLLLKLSIDKEDIKMCRGNKTLAESLIKDKPLEEKDKFLLIRFLSDYNWWKGGKTIDRADYYVSPILSLGNLVNASQGFVADICRNLSNNITALNILKSEIDRIEESIIIHNLPSSAKSEQIIYYGAPGTGKSFKVENREGESEEDRIRTTFHPDTDYSSFVGCYKPVPKEDDPDKITYRFIGQCFTKAYIEAWKRYVAPQDGQNRNFTLVIEEINRGNCAQIFGDIFQLLDRNGDGFSQYTISPDVDLTNFLAEQFDKIKEQMVEQGFEKIADGIEMKLPPNLSIIATMNTSDQSLFPIDSAFKRRWDWEYIPIQYSPIDDVTKETIANKINIKGTTYDWGEFIKAVNERIYQLTKSEDKELGYFFVRPDNGKNITTQRFVSKVIFYLWSDIYKDYAGRDNSIFKFSEDGDEKNKKEHSFNSFFEEKKINDFLVKKFIEQFIKPIDEEGENTSDAKLKYSINGEEPIGGRRIAVEVMKKYVNTYSQLTPQQVVDEWNTLGIKVTHFVETEDDYNSRTDQSLRAQSVEWGDGNKVYVTTHGWVYNTNEQYKVSTIKQLIDAVNEKDWGIKVDIIEQ